MQIYYQKNLINLQIIRPLQINLSIIKANIQKTKLFNLRFINSNITSLDIMTDLEQFAQVLTKWKDHDKKKINDILKRIDTLNLQIEDRFSKLNKPLCDFHKEIQNCDTEQVDGQWFSYVLKIKKKLKKVEENAKKKGNQKPVLNKKPSTHIQFPQQLFEGVRPSESQIIKLLFKNFVLHLPDMTSYTKNPRVLDFIRAVNIELRKIFEDQLEYKKNKRVDSICMHLSKEGCVRAKLEMLDGKKTPKQVADDEESAYKDEEKQKREQEHAKEQLQMAQTGVYNEMKKNIFKGASEECRFCRNKTAYCDDMKQIRASDEPMTRFMKCNTCGKNWRD